MLALEISIQFFSVSMLVLLLIDISYPSGELISLYLFRYKGFAVDHHSLILCASHLQ